MKTAKEFIERLKTDEEFAKEVGKEASGVIEAGENDYHKVFIPIAAKHGYEVTPEDLDSLYEEESKVLSEEELGKVAGGSTPVCGIIIVSIGTVNLTSLIYSIIDNAD